MHNLHFPARVIAEIKARGVCRGFCLGNLIIRNNLEDIGVDLRVLVKWILNKYDGMRRGLEWRGKVAGCCGKGCKLTGVTNYRKILN